MSKKTVRWVVLLCYSAISAVLLSGRVSASSATASRIDSLISMYHEYGLFGGTALVADRGEVIYREAFGLADREWDVSHTVDSKIRIGSLTKQFTSMLVLQLAQEGLLDLNGYITDYLPEYRHDISQQVTIYHLLTHTSGIPDFGGIRGFWQDSVRQHYTPERMLSDFCSRDLEFEPGTDFQYSNSGYYILGAIIEAVTGKTYIDNLRDRIFEPLGMNSTVYDDHSNIIKHRARGYHHRVFGAINARYMHSAIFHSAGALYSTVDDLYVWDRALYTDKLLSAEMRDVLFTPFLNNYACGWGVRYFPNGPTERDSTKVIYHAGGTIGGDSFITRLIDRGSTIILLSNTGTESLAEMNRNILNILLDRPFQMPRRSIAKHLYEILKHDSVEEAIQHFHALRTSHPDDYDFGENELNSLGYCLLHENRVAAAVAVFRANTETYPQSANAFDSYGEVLAVQGDTVQAIRNYERSLELNPQNTNARKILQNLRKED